MEVPVVLVMTTAKSGFKGKVKENGLLTLPPPSPPIAVRSVSLPTNTTTGRLHYSH